MDKKNRKHNIVKQIICIGLLSPKHERFLPATLSVSRAKRKVFRFSEVVNVNIFPMLIQALIYFY